MAQNLLITPEFSALLTRANDIESRFLTLPFRVEIGADGWTKDTYSMSDLHRVMNYPEKGNPSKPMREKLVKIVAKYEGLGVLKGHPPKGESRRLWFSYAAAAAPDSESHPPVTDTTANRIGLDSESHHDLAAHAIQNRIDPPRHDSESATGNRIGSHHDSDDDKHSIDPLPVNHHHEQLMDIAGVFTNARARLRELPPDALRTLLLHCLAGRLLDQVAPREEPRVRNAGALISNLAKRGGDVDGYFLTELSGFRSSQFDPCPDGLYWDIHLKRVDESDPVARKHMLYGTALNAFRDDPLALGAAYCEIYLLGETAIPETKDALEHLEGQYPGLFEPKPRLERPITSNPAPEDNPQKSWWFYLGRLRYGKSPGWSTAFMQVQGSKCLGVEDGVWIIETPWEVEAKWIEGVQTAIKESAYVDLKLRFVAAPKPVPAPVPQPAAVRVVAPAGPFPSPQPGAAFQADPAASWQGHLNAIRHSAPDWYLRLRESKLVSCQDNTWTIQLRSETCLEGANKLVHELLAILKKRGVEPKLNFVLAGAVAAVV